jgi:uncharacterized protein YggE
MKKIFVFVVSFVVMSGSAFAQSTPEPPSVVAQGHATVKQAADVAFVQIAVEARASRPEDARRQAATAMTSVMNVLRRSVPSDAIKTASFSVQPEMDYSNNRTQVRGYVARNQVEVRVDNLDKLSEVMDSSVAGGATSIAGLRFDVKKRAEAEREALRLAVEDAMGRADAIARGAGRSVGGILRIEEQRTFAQPMFRGMAMDSVAQSRAETPIEPGEIEIRAQVTATVGIR